LRNLGVKKEAFSKELNPGEMNAGTAPSLTAIFKCGGWIFVVLRRQFQFRKKSRFPGAVCLIFIRIVIIKTSPGPR